MPPGSIPGPPKPKFRGHRFYHEEGSIEWRRIEDNGSEDTNSTGGALESCYQYTIRDHLGNGKEYNRELGLNWYDYGARWYDPVIGRWNAVDPLAEKYYSINSYVYVANNPMLFIDPDGMRIGYGRGHFNRFMNEVQGKINQYRNEASNLRTQAIAAFTEGNIDKAADLATQSGEAETMADSYENVERELDILASSEQVYNLNTAATNLIAAGGAGSITYDTRKDEVNVNIAGLYNTGNFAHELKQAYQFEVGKLSFGVTGNGGKLYDVEDEIEAYAREAMFGEASKSKEEIINSPLYHGIKKRTSQLLLSTPYKNFFIRVNNKSYNERRKNGKRKEKIMQYYRGYKKDIIKE